MSRVPTISPSPRAFPAVSTYCSSPTERQASDPNISPVQNSPSPDDALVETEIQDDQPPNFCIRSSEFLPYQHLLRTVIMVECGEKLDQSYPIHLGLLKCYSKVARELFESAEPQRQAYESAEVIKKLLKNLVPPKLPYNAYTADKDMAPELAQEAMSIITRCFRKYPLLEYQTQIRRNLARSTKEVFSDKIYWKSPPSAGELKKKEKDIPVDNVLHRLQLLNSEAIGFVARQLYPLLQQIKAAEKTENPRKDRSKAAAQSKILLPHVDELTVGYLVQWIYERKLQFENPGQLCNLHGLAEELGVTILAQTCLSKLSVAFFEAIKHAHSEGISLRALTEESHASSTESRDRDTNPLVGIVWTVFQFVLEHKEPPAELQQMVVEAIADSADPQLIAKLTPLMSHGISLQVSMALVRRLFLAKIELAKRDDQFASTYHNGASEQRKIKTELRSSANGDHKSMFHYASKPTIVNASQDDSIATSSDYQASVK